MSEADTRRENIAANVYEAVMSSAEESPQGTSIVFADESFDALLYVSAVVIANSPKLNTDDAVEAFCRRAASNLGRQIRQVRADPRFKMMLPPEGIQYDN